MLECCAYHRCQACEKINRCPDGRKALLNRHGPDKTPDSITNDFIYMRGDYDAFHKINKNEIRRASELYREKIIQTRKELGLK